MKLTMFYLPTCPHCRLAFRFLSELREEDPRYAGVEIDTVDESAQRALADSYDYFYVPCFYMGEEKLHEGHAEKDDVRRVLDRALETVCV
jgi:glutaredoxin